MRLFIKYFSLITFFILSIIFYFPINCSYAESGFISGRVTKSNGETPIAGATITIFQIVSEDEEEWGDIVTTDSNGDYVIGSIPSGIYEITASLSGFKDSTKSNISVSSSKITPNIDFSLLCFGSISGKVTEDDGATPIDSTDVSAIDIKTGHGVPSTSEANGEYIINKLLPGNYTIMATADSYSFPTMEEVDLLEGEDIQNVNIKAYEVSQSSISGKVTENDGVTPISGANLFFSLHPQDIGIIEKYLGKNPEVITGLDGTYIFENLYPATYVVEANAQNYGTEVRSIAVPLNTAIGNIDFSLSLGGSISGTVLLDDSSPVGGSRIICVKMEVPWQPLSKEVITDSNGVYTIPDLSGGAYTVQVVSEDYPTKTIENVNLNSGENKQGVNFILSSSVASISGKVVDAVTRRPINYAFILIYPLDPESTIEPKDTLTSDGFYLVGGLEAETYSIMAGAVGYQESTINGVVVTSGSALENIDFALIKQ